MKKLIIKFSVFPLVSKLSKSPEEIISILSETIFSEFSIKSEEGIVKVYEKEKGRVYDEEVFDFADCDSCDVYTVKDFNEAVTDGIFTDYDGSGYWVKDGKECSEEVFHSPQLDATHVAWYNK